MAVGGPAVLALLRRPGKIWAEGCTVSRYLNIIFPPMQQAFDGVCIYSVNFTLQGLHGYMLFRSWLYA